MISFKELCPFLVVVAVVCGQPVTTKEPAEEPQPSTSTVSGRALPLQEDEDEDGDVDGADAAVPTATLGTVGTGIVGTAINVLTNGGMNGILPQIRPDPNALLDVPRIFIKLFTGAPGNSTPSMVGLGVLSRTPTATRSPSPVVQNPNPILNLLTSLFRRHTSAGVVAGMTNYRNLTSKLDRNYGQEATNSILYGQQQQRQGVLFNQTVEGGIQHPPRQGIVEMNEAVRGGDNVIVEGGGPLLPLQEQTPIQIVLE